LAPRLRSDIEELAAIERGSASPGEQRSAEWVATRLREQGAGDVRTEPFAYQGTFAHAQGIHFAVGLLAALGRRRLLAAATLASFELEYSGRQQLLRGLLPKGTGFNVTGRLPAIGPVERTLVLVAHHDAARTGAMWDPRMSRLGDRAAARTGKRASLALLPEAALMAAALGLRRLPAAVLGLALALLVDQARSPVVPGANDNASGVAALLGIARDLSGSRPASVRVVLLSAGSEETMLEGMGAFLGRHRDELDPARTLVVCLDQLGWDRLLLRDSEGVLRRYRSRPEDVDLLVDAADVASVRVEVARSFVSPSDGLAARWAGFPTLFLSSAAANGGYPHYHRPSDVPANVNIETVLAARRLCTQLVAEINAARSRSPAGRADRA
jgi:hypothetical protein